MASSSAVGDDEQPNKRQRLTGKNDHSDSNGEVPIRTVHVRGITRQTIDEINNYFGQFGEVESVSMRFEDVWTQWCLVQFKRPEDAEEALSWTGHKWNGFDVKAADLLHQPDHPLQVAPEQDSDSNISVALNDKCLQAIFERLKPSCLSNMAGVCKRFNTQAKITFALRHTHLDFIEQFYSHHDSIEAMKHFGKDIQSLGIDFGRFSKKVDVYHVIDRYCGPKLKQLELRNFHFDTDSLALHSIFGGIEQLKLDQCASSSASIGMRESMTCCGELKSLSLSSCCSKDALSASFPKLQELSFDDTSICDETFENFVRRHSTLIKLSIENERLTPRLLQTIGQHAKNLQELKFVQVQVYNVPFQNEAAHIGQLSSLKNLQLYFQDSSIVPLLNGLVAGKVPIESMDIQFVSQPDIAQAIGCISQLKRIKVLHLKSYVDTRRVTDEDVVKLAEGLPELEELHLEEIHDHNRYRLDYEFKSQLSTAGLRQMLMHANKLKLLTLRWIDSINIDVDDYKVMLSTVQKREEEVPLVIEIHGEADQVDVPASVLAENQSTFNIKLIC